MPLLRSVPTCVSAPGSEGPPEQGHGYLSLWSKLCPQLLQTAATRPPEDLTQRSEVGARSRVPGKGHTGSGAGSGRALCAEDSGTPAPCSTV